MRSAFGRAIGRIRTALPAALLLASLATATFAPPAAAQGAAQAATAPAAATARLASALSALPANDPLALLRPEAVPFVRGNGLLAWERYLVQEMHRAFAVSPRGAWGMRIDAPDAETARRDALAACKHYAREECTLWSVDLAIADRPAPRPPARQAGPLRPSDRHLHFGPRAAQGVIVWSHGSYTPGDGDDATARRPVPQPWVRRLNVAGWDVWRFDRSPHAENMDETLPQLRQGIAALRAQGYRRVIAAGQSRGGWLSMRLLETPAEVDGVVAVAPARHGTDPELRPRALSDFFALLDRVRRQEGPAGPRVALLTFEGDPFDPGPASRARAAREVLSLVGLPALVIDRPPGQVGHGAGASVSFNDTYGACLARFLDFAQAPPARC
ncbi:MAG: hypothetical protein IT557_01080 [Alphaproteobacteria bacterium]|nr:hypothetical protein [Alphaproteobacteria bacterium]